MPQNQKNKGALLPLQPCLTGARGRCGRKSKFLAIAAFACFSLTILAPCTSPAGLIGREDDKIYEIDLATGHLRFIGSTGLPQNFNLTLTVDHEGGVAYVYGGKSNGEQFISATSLFTGETRHIPVHEPISAIAARAGGLIARDNNEILEIDLETGALREIGTTGLPQNYNLTLTVDQTFGIAYVYGGQGNGQEFISATDLSTGVTRQIPLALPVSVIAATPGGLVARNDQLIYNIDLETGELQLIGTTGLPQNFNLTLTADPGEGTVHVLAGETQDLLHATTTNISTGENTHRPLAGAIGTIAAFSPRSPAESILPISSISLTRDGLQLTMPPAFRRTIGIEYSQDMISWIELGNAPNVGGVAIFTDPDPVRLARPMGYYRAFLRPLL
jgi:hypothetical protein